MANLLKGLPGTPALQGDLVVTASDETTALFTISREGVMGLPVETALTAAAGGTQAGALALSSTKSIHNVATVGTAADSVKLPLATGSGAIHFVKNSAAANSMQIFGSGTDTIDGVATATGVAIAAGKARLLCDVASGEWVSLLGA